MSHHTYASSARDLLPLRLFVHFHRAGAQDGEKTVALSESREGPANEEWLESVELLGILVWLWGAIFCGKRRICWWPKVLMLFRGTVLTILSLSGALKEAWQVEAIVSTWEDGYTIIVHGFLASWVSLFCC